MDHDSHRDQGTSHRRERRTDERHGRESGAEGDRTGENFAHRNRSYSRRHGHSRHALSRDSLFRSEKDRGHQGRLCFLFGLEIAQQFITSHTHDTVLVIGAEKLTSITNWTDRNTCVLFGDGAGAAVLRHRGSAHGVISTHIGSDGKYSDILFMPGGGSRCPITRENVDLNLQTIHMTGKEVYKQAVTAMLKAAKKALDQAGLAIEDIACIIPHQANVRIIEAIADRLGISREKMFVNLDRYGNTSAAAVAIALDEANRSGRIKPGDYILMVVFGGGLTWASTVIEW